jgi:pimeloyl-ACP methyl ester carboxylesterase
VPFIQTRDHVQLYYRDWGTGKPVVFISSYVFSGEMWEYQMQSLSEQGLRTLAPDRRGHGRSDDPGRGYDFDTLTDDLAELLRQLDLSDVTLVGHSMGRCEIARYMGRHGANRVARVVLISSATPGGFPILPEGAPQDALDAHISAISTNRPHYLRDAAIRFFAPSWPLPGLSSEQVEQALQIALQTSPKALVETLRAHWKTDFRSDLSAFSVPTLVIQAAQDQSAPLELMGHPTAQAIAKSQLIIYSTTVHGLFYTERDRLKKDLLSFIQG